MRVLFITNYYPPCDYDWGYMQLCEEAADGLAARGYDVAVLTSTYRHGLELERPYPVHRLLPIDPDWHSGQSAMQQFFFERKQKEAQSLRHLRNVVARFQPDVIFAWHCIGLSRVMLQEVEKLPEVAAAFYFANYMPELPDEYWQYWQSSGTTLPARLLKRVVAPLALRKLKREGKPIRLDFENSACVSDYVRQRLVSKQLIGENAVVIHNGVDLDVFSRPTAVSFAEINRPLRCLVAGRVDAEKGVHTVVEAFARLQANGRAEQLRLTILGSGPSDYEQTLRQCVETAALQTIVTFQEPVPREQMPAILEKYDILILASEYAEPLARAGQEAMGMGLLVVGTTTGGGGELLFHDETGLVFTAGDARSLADQLECILDEPERATILAESGRQLIHEHFTIERMCDEIESFLLSLINEQQTQKRGTRVAS